MTGSTAAAMAAITATGMVDLDRAADSCPADIHVPADAEDLSTATVTFNGPVSPLIAYHARPRNMPAAQIANLAGPIILSYAELDGSNTGTLNKTFGFTIYEGVNHAFHNDTGANYRAGAAGDAWGKTIDFFTRHLRA